MLIDTMVSFSLVSRFFGESLKLRFQYLDETGKKTKSNVNLSLLFHPVTSISFTESCF